MSACEEDVVNTPESKQARRQMFTVCVDAARAEAALQQRFAMALHRCCTPHTHNVYCDTTLVNTLTAATDDDDDNDKDGSPKMPSVAPRLSFAFERTVPAYARLHAHLARSSLLLNDDERVLDAVRIVVDELHSLPALFWRANPLSAVDVWFNDTLVLRGVRKIDHIRRSRNDCNYVLRLCLDDLDVDDEPALHNVDDKPAEESKNESESETNLRTRICEAAVAWASTLQSLAQRAEAASTEAAEAVDETLNEVCEALRPYTAPLCAAASRVKQLAHAHLVVMDG